MTKLQINSAHFLAQQRIWTSSSPTLKFFLCQHHRLLKFVSHAGNIGIIYDCKNLIPLAATAVLTADQYGDEYDRRGMSFKTSSQIRDDLQQNDVDYTDPLKRIPCYETTTKQYFTEQKWYEALTKGTVVSNTNPCPHDMKKSAIHRGHLIAASYGRGTPENMRIKKTFVYTNAVLQFVLLHFRKLQS